MSRFLVINYERNMVFVCICVSVSYFFLAFEVWENNNKICYGLSKLVENFK